MSEQNWKTPGYDPSKNGWWRASLGQDSSNFGYPNTYLFADSMRAVIQAFGKHFSNLWVVHYDENGYPRKRIQVPIKFGPRSKAYDFRKEQEMKARTGRTYYIPQPNLTYKITGTQYDESRAVSVDTVRTFYDTALMKRGVEYSQLDLLWQDTVPVPYKVNIELNANCEMMSDAMQIWEQICGQFSPDINLNVKEFWFMDIPRNIKVVLQSTSFEFSDEFGEDEKREVNVRFQFELECVIYTGIQDGSIIDQIRVILNPGMSKTSDTTDIYSTFSGFKDGTISLDYSEGQTGCIWSDISAAILVKDGDLYRVSPDMFTSGYVTSSLVPRYDTEQDRRMDKPSDWYIEYVLTSSYTTYAQEGHSAFFNVSGNYRPEPGTYSTDTFEWQGSLTDRYRLDKLSSSQHSATKDFFDGKDIVRTTIATEHYDNEGKSY